MSYKKPPRHIPRAPHAPIAASKGKPATRRNRLPDNIAGIILIIAIIVVFVCSSAHGKTTSVIEPHDTLAVKCEIETSPVVVVGNDATCSVQPNRFTHVFAQADTAFNKTYGKYYHTAAGKEVR